MFTSTPYTGNPVAVVLDADGLSVDAMQRFANWTNLSETTFVLTPSAPGADYQVRIFTPDTELPFAGHPTLGTCHAWLEHRGESTSDRTVQVVQQCAVGLIPVRCSGTERAFAAPPLVRDGPVEPADLARVVASLGLDASDVVDAAWVDNGPGWIGVLLRDAAAVLAVRPGLVEGSVGVVGPYPEGSPYAFEVRGFFPKQGATAEDPVTGSLNASLAQWLLQTGRAQAPYVASQGTALNRSGRITISHDPDGTIWVAGGAVTCIAGQVEI